MPRPHPRSQRSIEYRQIHGGASHNRGIGGKWPLLLLVFFLTPGCRSDPVQTASLPTPEQPTPSQPVSALPTQSPEIAFERRSFSVGEGPSAAAAADLDGDGHQDLVVANEIGDDLSILLGDGQGRLRALDRVPAGSEPTDIAISDLDGDGWLDIIVANHDTDYLTLLLGDGSGGFRPAANSPLQINVNPHPHIVRVVDVDLDGIQEIIVDHREGRGLLIMKGVGSGEFQTPGTLVPGAGDPYRGFAMGDIDGDGNIDFITPNPADVGVLLSTDPEGFGYAQQEPVPAAAPFAVALADLNGDLALDLIAASDEGSALVQIFQGDGRGSFNETAYSPIELAPGGKYIALGDFNGDGLKDAAIASYQSTEVMLLLGGADAIQTVMLSALGHPWGMVATDLNEDGFDDLIVLDNTSTEAAVFLSLSD